MIGQTVDPIKFVKLLWPDIYLYDKQRQIMYSVADNDETVVPAGNMLGKDFVAALTVLWFFMSRHPCRVVTTSVDATQLNAVLWGELRRFIQSAAIPITTENGGPLIVNDLLLRKVVRGAKCGLSYVMGRVANDTGEGMLGHHIAKTGDGIPRTLFVPDECSGVPHVYWDKADTWADRKLAIGNPFECSNFFKYAVKGKPGSDDKGGDIPRANGNGFHRKIIKIKAEDSPNVRLGLKEVSEGKQPSYRMLVHGVKDYATYEKNRIMWDKIKQCVSLDAEFYEGSEVMLYPPEWLNRAETLAISLPRNRSAKAIGVDPAQGGDNTAMCAIDEKGVIELVSKKTPDTSIINSEIKAFIRKHKVPAECVMIDTGGGGHQHADNLRKDGYNVRTVGFGEAASPHNLFIKYKSHNQKIDERDEKYAYKNRRAEMYGLLRLLLDPYEPGFAIPGEYVELRRQLSPIPILYDGEGRLRLPPKHKKEADSSEVTMTEIIGCSPDEADALVLAVFGMLNKATPRVVSAL